jgi:hypothetical protein
MVKHPNMDLVTWASEAAASASERLVPPLLLGALDRRLLDVVCLAGGGVRPVASRLGVDVPAVDAWRSLGIPGEFRGRLTAMAVWPPRGPLPALRSLSGLRPAA